MLLDPSPPPIPVNAQPVQAVYSSWGPSGCGPVGPEVSPVSQSSYEWRKLPGDLSRQYLYKDGKQVAGYDFTTGVFRWYDAAKDSWSEPENPPWKEPVGGALANFGVALERIPKTDAGAYWLNGVLASAQSVQQAIENRSLADDSAKLRLTLIGSKARCDQVQADLQTHPALAPFRDKFLIQSYRPGHWATDVFKLPPGQEFYLSVQTAADVKGKGIELHAQDYYAGPELLAAGLSEAQRRADPNYDPKKTPDVTKPKPKPDDPAASNQTLLLIGGLILCVVLFLLGNNRDDLN